MEDTKQPNFTERLEEIKGTPEMKTTEAHIKIDREYKFRFKSNVPAAVLDKIVDSRLKEGKSVNPKKIVNIINAAPSFLGYKAARLKRKKEYKIKQKIDGLSDEDRELISDPHKMAAMQRFNTLPFSLQEEIVSRVFTDKTPKSPEEIWERKEEIFAMVPQQEELEVILDKLKKILPGALHALNDAESMAKIEKFNALPRDKKREITDRVFNKEVPDSGVDFKEKIDKLFELASQEDTTEQQ